MGEWSRLELPMTGGCYCGAIQHDEQEREGYLYVTVGSLDRPDLFPPAYHWYEDERLPWDRTAGES
jgi:Uncharacterized conserved protein